MVGRDMYAEFTIGFAGYGRFKDMRQLLYEKMPPIEAMEEFVKEVGLEKFGYVPGYLLNAKYRVLHITDSRAINRIAWGIAVSRLKMGVKRGTQEVRFTTPCGASSFTKRVTRCWSPCRSRFCRPLSSSWKGNGFALLRVTVACPVACPVVLSYCLSYLLFIFLYIYLYLILTCIYI